MPIEAWMQKGVPGVTPQRQQGDRHLSPQSHPIKKVDFSCWLPKHSQLLNGS